MGISEDLVAAVECEIAMMQASDAALTPRHAESRGGRQQGPTRVYSFRLDLAEVAALERRAAVLGLGPTVLARNFVRSGLRGTGVTPIAVIVDRLESAVAELRAHAP